MSVKSGMRFFMLLVAGVILTLTTVVFGALPMRILRRVYGRAFFWSIFAIAAIAMAILVSPSYGLLLLALTMAVGVYSEIEEHGGSVFVSGFAAALAALGLSVLGIALWIKQTKMPLIETLRGHLAPLVERLAKLNNNSGLTVDSLMQQLPSGIVIGLIMAIAISLIAEKKVMKWLGGTASSVDDTQALASHNGLSSFSAPDAFIWITILAIFGAFFKHGNVFIETVCLNTLNILVVVFFFQGLAVVSHAFKAYKISPYWQGLWYVVLVIQLFLLVSLLGFADFWMEFRTRISRKPAQTNKSF